MRKCDILIAGASTTGSWFAYEMAKRGFSVTVIEKQAPDNISRDYDIFHMARAEMEKFDLEIPEPGDKEYAFEFAGSPSRSPYGNYPKSSGEATIGLHKHDYIMKMIERAKKAGAEYIFEAPFRDFIYDENKKIVGASYGDGEEIYAKLVADCTGIPSAARTKLPDSSFVENYKLSPEDIFYVVLYYALYPDENVNPRALDAFFMQYKAWSAPSGDDRGAILGIGGSYSYEYAQEIFKDFRKNVPWPEYEVVKTEKGRTPYHRSLYCFVEDNFIAMGDTAFLTKPTCGEGCTSSLYQARIAVDVISGLLKDKKELTQKNMWRINKEYVEVQGKDFDSLRPLLVGIVQADYDEAEFLFRNDVIFSQKILGGMGEELELNGKDIAKMISVILGGIAAKKIRPSVIKEIIKGLLYSSKVTALYKEYPDSPEGFPEWRKKADDLWASMPKVADACDKDILRKLGNI